MTFNTYVINLKKDTKKWNQIQEDFRNTGIHLNRFDAIYGKKMTKEDLEFKKENTTTSCKLFCTDGVIGCGLSHIKLAKKILKEDPNDFALILEDDVSPRVNNFKDEIYKAVERAPKDWDIILLYTQGVTNYKDNTWECTNISGSAIAYLINYNGFKKRYDDYKVKHLPDLERCFVNCNIYKTPTMYFKPEFSESSTSSENKNFMAPVYSFLDNLYYDELETDITGFSGSMAGCYKLIRIPYLEYELDFLEILFTIIIFFSLLAIVLSKKKFNTLSDSIIYGFGFFALVLACIKIYINIIN